MKSKNMRKMTGWFTVLLTMSIIFGGEIVNGSTGDEVKEITMKTPATETGAFKIEKTIEDTLFADPIAGTIDDQGNIYITDRKLVKLFKFSREGKPVNSIGKKGTGPGDFSMPMIVKYRDKKLYVIEFQLPHINIFDTDLNLIEQKKLPDMRTPASIEFIGDDIIVSSSLMRMFMFHQLFLFSANGELKAKHVPDEQSDPAKVIKGKTMTMKMPSLLYIDPTSGNLWCAAVAPYEITVLDKKFETVKVLRGDKTFKFTEQEAGRGRMTMKMPLDMGTFFTGKNGKMFYGYRYDSETYLDVIENDRITRRFKSKEIRKILSMVDRNTFLVSFYEGKEDGDPAVGIVSIEL